MLHSVELKDYMLKNPVKVKADADLFDAIEAILEYKISGVCVVDDENHPDTIVAPSVERRAISGNAHARQQAGSVRHTMRLLTDVGPEDDDDDDDDDPISRHFHDTEEDDPISRHLDSMADDPIAHGSQASQRSDDVGSPLKQHTLASAAASSLAGESTIHSHSDSPTLQHRIQLQRMEAFETNSIGSVFDDGSQSFSARFRRGSADSTPTKSLSQPTNSRTVAMMTSTKLEDDSAFSQPDELVDDSLLTTTDDDNSTKQRRSLSDSADKDLKLKSEDVLDDDEFDGRLPALNLDPISPRVPRTKKLGPIPGGNTNSENADTDIDSDLKPSVAPLPTAAKT